MKEITDNQSMAEVVNSPGINLIKVYAQWCGPCKMLPQILDVVEKEHGGNADFFAVDSDKVSEFGFDVTNIPAVVIFKDGQLEASFTGVNPSATYSDAIKVLLDVKED